MVLLEFAMAPHGQPLQVLSHVTLGIADVLTRPERPLTLLADYRIMGRQFQFAGFGCSRLAVTAEPCGRHLPDD